MSKNIAKNTNLLNPEEGIALHTFNSKHRESLKYGPTGDEESLFFNDGKRRIDFVLVYQTGTKASDTKKNGKRANFQDQLEDQGIEFELQTKPVPGEPPEVQLCFVKLHATWELLTRYADIMKIRMPLKKDVEHEEEVYREDQISRYCPNPLKVDKNLLPRTPHYVSTGFSKSKANLFNITDKETFFSPSQRIRIIWECLSRIQFAQSNPSHIGIQKLLADGTFLAAFPLHDGPWEAEAKEKPSNLRTMLYNQWGTFFKWYKFQPIEHIKNYFGERMGFYFGWMEFYTLMLLPAVFIGLICMIYGIASLGTDPVVNEICKEDSEIGETVMCPICERQCPYWKLKESCGPEKITYLVDNPATICFATFMALWASVFVILWKRKQTILSWNFDTYYATEQEEPVRPELEAEIKPDKWKINPVTLVNEPYVSPWRRMLQSVLSGTVIIFMIVLVFAAVFGTIVYRTMVNVLIFSTAKSADDDTEQSFTVKNSTYIIGFTAALLNLIVIIILNGVYYLIAKWLTEKEYPRTQSEYENSLTIKYYIFEFVNTYTSLFYVAFIKGRAPPPLPGDQGILGLPQDHCDKGGCLIELTIQLFVLFIGSTFFNFINQLVFPLINQAIRNRRHARQIQRNKHDYRWERDYDLRPYPGMSMFLEYSRMVTQFGFITMFVAAFPIAPIFALISNLLEIRLNGNKYLTLHRRPVPTFARDIGAWGDILENVARFAVITNGFIIAFSSDFVAKLAYVSHYSLDGSLTGYTKWSLSTFSSADFPFGTEPELPGQYWGPLDVPKSCSYREFRSGPNDNPKNALNQTFWHVFAARVILVLVFEHFIMLATKIFSYFVPEIPASLKAKVLRENFLAKEAFYEAAASRKQDGRKSSTPV